MKLFLIRITLTAAVLAVGIPGLSLLHAAGVL